MLLNGENIKDIVFHILRILYMYPDNKAKKIRESLKYLLFSKNVQYDIV